MKYLLQHERRRRCNQRQFGSLRHVGRTLTAWKAGPVRAAAGTAAAGWADPRPIEAALGLTPPIGHTQGVKGAIAGRQREDKAPVKPSPALRLAPTPRLLHQCLCAQTHVWACAAGASTSTAARAAIRRSSTLAPERKVPRPLLWSGKFPGSPLQSTKFPGGSAPDQKVPQRCPPQWNVPRRPPERATGGACRPHAAPMRRRPTPPHPLPWLAHTPKRLRSSSRSTRGGRQTRGRHRKENGPGLARIVEAWRDRPAGADSACCAGRSASRGGPGGCS